MHGPKYLISLVISSIVFCWLSSFELTAQEMDTTLARQYWDRANEMIDRHQYDSAIHYYQLSGESFRDAGNCQKFVHGFMMQGFYNRQLFRIDESKRLYENGIAVADSCLNKNHFFRGLLIGYLSGIHHLRQDFVKALELNNESIDILLQKPVENEERIAGAYHQNGLSYYFLGDTESSMEAFIKQVEIEEINGNTTRRKSRLAFAYQNIGNCLKKKGDFDRALPYYTRALNLRKEIRGENHSDVGVSYVNLAKFYSEQGNHEEALHWSRKGLKVYETIFTDFKPIMGHTYMGLGDAFMESNQIDSALYYLNQARTKLEQFYNKPSPHVADSYHKIGDLYIDQMQVNRAIRNYQKALDIRLKVFDEKHPVVSETYLAFAKALLRKGDILEALDYFQKSLVSNSRTFDGIKMDENPAYEDIINPQIILESFTLKTQTLFSLAEGKSGNEKTNILRAAWATASQGGDVSHYLRQAFKVESSKLRLLDQTRPLFEIAIAVCDQLFLETNNEKWLREAFQFAEQSKAIVLFEAVKASGAKVFAGIPPSLLEEEIALKRELDFYTQQAWEKNDASWEEKRFKLYNDYEKFVDRLEREYPEYYQLKYDTEVSTIDDIRDILDEDMAMISFFHGDQATYAFTLTQKDIEIHKIDAELLTSDKIKAYYQHISDSESRADSLHFYGFSLYENLIQKPLMDQDKVKRLIVIPDGLLGYIPFDLLLTQKPNLHEEWDYRKFPWLIYQYQISYAYSATLLNENIQRKTASNSPYIGFAPKYDHASSELTLADQADLPATFRGRGSVEGYFDLPGAREEVEEARAIFNGEAFVGEEATEKRIKELDQHARILHLAMHAKVNDHNPLQSRLIFSADGDTTEDGILNVFEIYNMALRSQLTVLSACNTGYGEIRKGEGVISLSRAFMYAGCPSILTTLWRAKDQTTQDIVSGFFQRLKAGETRAEALHQAKLDYLSSADPLKAHPVHWANFVLIGNPEPLQKQMPFWTWLWIGAATLLLIGVFWKFRSR